MVFTLSINLENAAFDEQPGAEIARMLRKVADEVEANDLNPASDYMARNGRALRDINGNTVGTATVLS